MKKKMYHFAFIFLLGAFGYGLIEIIWRGFTHPSMLLAGGISFLCLSIIEEHLGNLRLLYKCVLGGLSITLIEFIFGYIFNYKLKLNVWDYSSIPLNLNGQICLLYTCMWSILSIPFFSITKKIRKCLV